MQNIFQKGLSVLTSTALIGGFLFSGISSTTVNAAGVNLAVSPSAQDVAITGNVTLSFTPDVALNNGDTITVTIPNGYTGGASLTDADVAVSGTGITSEVTSGISATGFTSTLTTSGAVSGAVTITIGGTNQLTTPISEGNYAWSISTSAGDFSSNFQYVGEDNQVLVTAIVPVSLSFDITEPGDINTNTNLCDMGTLTPAAVGTCSYRLKIGTNAANGYTVSVTTDGDFDNADGTAGSYAMANAAVGAGGAGGADIDTATTETYGAIIDEGVLTSGAGISVAAGYDAGAVNEVEFAHTGAAETMITAAGSNDPTTTGETILVTHKAKIEADTGSGTYTQRVTYTVSPSF